MDLLLHDMHILMCRVSFLSSFVSGTAAVLSCSANLAKKDWNSLSFVGFLCVSSRCMNLFSLIPRSVPEEHVQFVLFCLCPAI